MEAATRKMIAEYMTIRKMIVREATKEAMGKVRLILSSVWGTHPTSDKLGSRIWLAYRRLKWGIHVLTKSPVRFRIRVQWLSTYWEVRHKLNRIFDFLWGKWELVTGMFVFFPLLLLEIGIDFVVREAGRHLKSYLIPITNLTDAQFKRFKKDWELKNVGPARIYSHEITTGKLHYDPLSQVKCLVNLVREYARTNLLCDCTPPQECWPCRFQRSVQSVEAAGELL